MITSIIVNGFKTLSDFHLALNPGLNILVGPNGSGKTNIISFFEFLSHLILHDPSEATSHLGGAGAVFRRVKDTCEATVSAKITGCYPLNVQGNPFAHRRVSQGQDQDFALYEYDFSLLFSNELEAVVFTKQSFRYRHVNHFISASEFIQNGTSWFLDLETSLETDMSIKTKVRSLKGEFENFIPIFGLTKGEDKVKEVEEFISKFVASSTAIPSLLIRFSPLMMLLSDDIAGGQTYNIIPSKIKIFEDCAKLPGISRDGSGLSSTLYALRRRKVSVDQPMWNLFMPQSSSALKRPSFDMLLSYFQLANNAIQDIDVTNDPFSNQLRVTFKICNGEYTANVPLTLMSDGTLKWLTLLTAALTANSIFSIEEPENYLHPQMQGQFIKIMREILFNERKHACTLMTTHSETVLNHCKPSELAVVSLQNGKTVASRKINDRELSVEIEKTGFGLGYYYIAGALQNE